MSESMYQYVLDQLSLAKGSWPSVAEATGIPYRTIEKIGRQETKDPGVSSIETLASYFRAQTPKNPVRQHAPS